MLAPGIIVEIAKRAGLQVPERGTDKKRIRCPFHEDRRPSAFISEARNIFHCSVCTPGHGWGAKRLAQELGVAWETSPHVAVRTRQPRRARLRKESFPAERAQAIWSAALARARDDDHVDQDRAVYEYLDRRGLSEAWERGCYGILGEDMELPDDVAWWPGRGFRLVVPLFNESGELVNIQARRVVSGDPKTLFPKNSFARQVLFATDLGLEVLRDRACAHDVVLVAEGLTDYLAIAAAASVPVLAVPGAGIADAVIGPWITNKTLVLALDQDTAGETASREAGRAAWRQGAAGVHKITWPQGCKDACDTLMQLGGGGFSELIESAVDAARSRTCPT